MKNKKNDKQKQKLEPCLPSIVWKHNYVARIITLGMVKMTVDWASAQPSPKAASSTTTTTIYIYIYIYIFVVVVVVVLAAMDAVHRLNDHGIG
jgi:hypothetical protein